MLNDKPITPVTVAKELSRPESRTYLGAGVGGELFHSVNMVS